MELILWFAAVLIVGSLAHVALYGKPSFHRHEWKLDSVHQSQSIYSDKKVDLHHIYFCDRDGCEKFTIETFTIPKEKNEH